MTLTEMAGPCGSLRLSTTNDYAASDRGQGCRRALGGVRASRNQRQDRETAATRSKANLSLEATAHLGINRPVVPQTRHSRAYRRTVRSGGNATLSRSRGEHNGPCRITPLLLSRTCSQTLGHKDPRLLWVTLYPYTESLRASPLVLTHTD